VVSNDDARRKVAVAVANAHPAAARVAALAREVAAQAARVVAVPKMAELRKEAEQVRAAQDVVDQERQPLPLELKVGQRRIKRLAHHARRAAQEYEHATDIVGKLQHAQPQGWRRLIAWSIGSSRRHAEPLAAARDAAELARQHHRARTFIAEGAAARQTTKEAAWRTEVAADRARRRQALAVRAAWLADVVTALDCRPELALRSEAELADAVRRSREVREKVELAFRSSISVPY